MKNDRMDPVMRPAVKQKIIILPAMGASLASTIWGPAIMHEDATYPLLTAKVNINTRGKTSLSNKSGS